MVGAVKMHICPDQGGVVGGLEEDCEICKLAKEIDACWNNAFKAKRCECGAEKVYGKSTTLHQDYCPKHEASK